MRPIDSNEFLIWAGDREIGPDDRYDEPRCLVYRPYRHISRFWPVPEQVHGWPTFVSRLLDGLEPWITCRLWFRGGRWPDQAKHEHTDANEEVRAAVLCSFGVEGRHSGAIEYDHSERERIITLAFLQLTLGWMSYDDLFIIPDLGHTFLYIDHDGVVHTEFRRQGLIKPFVEHMANKGYPLPTAPPNATFKRPRWMKKSSLP